MDASRIAGRALYGPGAKGLHSRAEKIAVDLFELQELGVEKLNELPPEDVAKGEGFLVAVARNTMQDAVRTLRRADKGKPNADADYLDARLRSTGKVELVGFEAAGIDSVEGRAHDSTEYARPNKRKSLDGRHAAGSDGTAVDSGYRITKSSPILRGVEAKSGRKPSHIDREAFSERALKALIDLLNTTERSVIDLTLLGHSQTQIAGTLDKTQGYISKVYRGAVEKLEASEYPELRALAWEASYAGREARREIVGAYPHSRRVVKHGPSPHMGGQRRDGRTVQ